MRTTEWVLIDTETSGLGMPIYCVELAAQRMRGISPDGPPFRELLNHDVPIEPQAEAMHGYSRNFLRANGQSPDEVHRSFNEYAGQRPVVSYNLSFDWARVLEPELRRLGLSAAYVPGFCALTLARRCVHETSGHRLEVLRGHFFPDLGVASHHALDDVVVTSKLLSEVIWPRLEQAGIQTFPAVAAFSRQTPVKECLRRIRSPVVAPPIPVADTPPDPELELRNTIEGMLADDQIIDAEAWSLKYWLDMHDQHRTQLAQQCRAVLDAAFADGKLSKTELVDMRTQLGAFLVGAQSQASTCAPPAEAVPVKKRRLSLTKRQLEEETGLALLTLLRDMVADGKLSDTEIEKLAGWLRDNRNEGLPAIDYLVEIIDEIVADGTITESERMDLHLGIEKVLPVTERRAAKAAREDVQFAIVDTPGPIARDDLERMVERETAQTPTVAESWRSDPMTEAQDAYIRSLGGSIRAAATKGEASDLIESLLANKPISSRQQMVMRFWGRERQSGEGPREISEWMDEFYIEDPDRKLAWELFKDESEDNGLQGDPMRVPVGAGPHYLARIKAGGDAAVPRFRPDPATGEAAGSNLSKLKWLLFAALATIAAVVLARFVQRG